MTLEEFLQTRAPFTSLSDAERAQLSASCVRRTFEDREALFHEGECGQGIYLVTKGTLRLDLNHPNGTQFMVSLVQEGNMTDHEIAADAPHPTSAYAMKKAVAYVMPKKELKSMMLKNPAFMESCFRTQDASRRYLLSLFAHAVSLTPEVRLARILLTFYKLFSEPGSNKLGYDFSQEALADMVASSRQNTSKMIKRWKQAGIIGMRYASIEILDAQKLCDIAGWSHERWHSGKTRDDNSMFSRLK
ncbi:Crp/Fnr family transcriptional regulator [Alcanivorax sp. 1008]|uniref:Crp/Fnr family transcriptional regulator n=1 Tax=Alcanivorax sp. 1008 TaxID=2816853 RepID=UPI001DF05307|nr:Crp/Fnr family transcriptional regulator [Alcanivorax sp. 1008]MCC1496484.1 Crp/Fnr family transcriptional regulator [Alcanivorax sp. 1008]